MFEMKRESCQRLLMILSVSFLVHLCNGGMMKKLKDKMKDKKCVPEVVAIKKTRVVPVAVPIKMDTMNSYEPEVMSMKDMSYSAPAPMAPAPSADPPSYTEAEGDDGGGDDDDPYSSSGGNYEDSSDDGDDSPPSMGYNDESQDDGESVGENDVLDASATTDDGDGDGGYDEGYGSEEGSSDSDDEYKRRSANTSSSLLWPSKKKHSKGEPSSSNSVRQSSSSSNKGEKRGPKSGHQYNGGLRMELMMSRRRSGSVGHELPKSSLGKERKNFQEQEEVDFKRGSQGWEFLTSKKAQEV